MKKLLVLSLILLSLPACKKSVEDLKILTPTTLSFGKGEESTNISITAYSDWSAQCDADWVTLYPAQGTGNSDGLSSYIKLTVAANSEYEDRTCTVSIVSNGKTFTVTVNQSTGTAILLSEDEREIEYYAQSLSVKGEANVPIQVEIPPSCSWIKVSATKGLSDFGYAFDVAENESKEPRDGVVFFKNTESKDKDTLTVHQAGKPLVVFCGTPGIYDGGQMLAGYREYETQTGLFRKSGVKEFHIVNADTRKYCLFVGLPDIEQGALPSEPFHLTVKHNMISGYSPEFDMNVTAYKYDNDTLWGADKSTGLGVIVLVK